MLTALQEVPKPVWIAVMILGFVWYWPVGLAVTAYLIGSRRMGRGRFGGPGRWYNMAQAGMAPGMAQAGAGGGQDQRPANGPWSSGWGQGGGCGWGWGRQRPAAPPPSGNRAFDEYRAETLRRLEEEQQEFVAYLERLRQAKDKAEFDTFMADRRRQAPPAPPSDPAAQD